MANFDFKTTTPDTSFPTGGFLLGADSQAAATPSIYAGTVYRDYIATLATTWSVNGAVSAPGSSYTGTWFTGGSATTTKPYFLVEPSGSTSTAWSTSGTGIGVNAASAFAGNLIDAQVSGASKFSVRSTGVAVIGGESTLTYTPTGAGGTHTLLVNGAASGFSHLSAYGLIDSGATFCFGGVTGSFAPTIRADIGLAWTNSSSNASLGTQDIFIFRDGAGALAQRNSTNAQTTRIYGTYTDSSNYRRLGIGSTAAGIFSIAPQGAGTGASGNVLHISGLPTSNPGPGILWNNAGSVAIGT